MCIVFGFVKDLSDLVICESINLRVRVGWIFLCCEDVAFFYGFRLKCEITRFWVQWIKGGTRMIYKITNCFLVVYCECIFGWIVVGLPWKRNIANFVWCMHNWIRVQGRIVINFRWTNWFCQKKLFETWKNRKIVHFKIFKHIHTEIWKDNSNISINNCLIMSI